MKAVRVRAPGGAEVLVLEELPLPQPGPGQLRIRVEAVGVNFIEVYQRTGLYQVAMPMTPGTEAAGVVDAVGEGVSAWRVGDRVCSMNAIGAYAEFALVPADRAVRIPAGVTAREAAAVLLQGMTAQCLTASVRPLGPGDTCLVHAAAGGTGLLICQLARKRGARVIGTVSTEEKAAMAREAGADAVIFYTKEDFVARTKELTEGRGVQVIYDSVGRTTFLPGFDCIAPTGMMVLFGQSSGKVDPIDPLMLMQKGSLSLVRPTVNHYIQRPEDLQRRAGEVLGWLADGSLKLQFGGDFPLGDAAGAHRALEGRATAGKLLLLP